MKAMAKMMKRLKEVTEQQMMETSTKENEKVNSTIK
jgi:hypothetical protein